MEKVSFAKLKSSLSLPDLLSLQKQSFRDFLQVDVEPKKRKRQGLQAAFLYVFGDESKGEGLTNSNGNFILQYIHYSIGGIKHSPGEAKIRDLTYDASLKVWFRLLQKIETGKIKELSEQEVYMCDIPIMTENGSFIINGAERVIVTQIHRSPGVIFEEDQEKIVSQIGKKLYRSSIIPYRGAWIEFEYDLNNVLYVRIDKRRKIPMTTLLRAVGIDSDTSIIKLFYEIDTVDRHNFHRCEGLTIAEDVVDKKTGEVIFEALHEIQKDDIKVLKGKLEHIKVIKLDPALKDLTVLLTLRADPTKTKKEACNLIYRILRTSEFITSEIAEGYLESLLFKTRRYDLTKVGRYKLNEKLHNELKTLKSKKDFEFDIPSERKHTLTKEDIIATIKYIINLNNGVSGEVDDIDHLGNRRVRAIGELLENQIRMGIANLARFTRDRMNTVDKESLLTPRTLINTTPILIMLRRFFGTSQLSQFMDQTNPLAELTHKRRFSALGPGGLHRKRAGFEVRDVHHTHYGRICPVETPEGPNIGLITSMACYARVNEYGLIETPYHKVKNGKVLDEIEYLTADREDKYIIAQANATLDDNKRFSQNPVQCRYRGDIRYVSPGEIGYMDISPLQLVSPSTGLIPFLEHDDANRALMGSNMQRQAVPLLISEAPLVSTGIEERIAIDSYAVVCAKCDGEVICVSADEIVVYNDNGEIDIYHLGKYDRSNQNTCINYVPIVNKGDRVKKGKIIGDGPCTSGGQLALGRNLKVAFMSWEGYNFEDAILVSERVIRDDVFTSIHIYEFQVEARDTKMGAEEITRDIPNVGTDDLLQLDGTGIVRIGSDVTPGGILVGKTSPKGEQQVTMEERLLRAIFGKKAEDVVDASLRVPPGIYGKVIDVKILSRREKVSKKIEKKKLEEVQIKYENIRKKIRAERNSALNSARNKTEQEKISKYYTEKENELKRMKLNEQELIHHGDELPITVNKVVKVYIATKRKLQVGDKMAGRHGNKGVVAKILPVEDMPYMPDGTPIDIILSPLSIPSRMNVGQLLEAMLGWAADVLNIQMVCPVFDGADEGEVMSKIQEAQKYLRSKGVPEKYLPGDDCRITLYDGRTGEPFMEKVTIGNMYIMKLVHLVEDKIHARSTGPYSLITRQPLGGKAQFGGQRFGEMEVWAVEGYGAAHTLQEFSTVKSDDVVGRAKVYESIIKGEILSEPGIPESFKVLVRELQGVGLNVELLSTKKTPPGGEFKESKRKPEKEKVTA